MNTMISNAANEFGFVNARIRGMMSRFLRLDAYENLLQSKSYDEFIKMLAGTYYGPIISKAHPSGIPTPDELALILSGNFAEQCSDNRLDKPDSPGVERQAG